MAKLAQENFQRNRDGMVACELIIKEHTVIDFEGVHEQEAAEVAQARPIEFTELETATGLISKFFFFSYIFILNLTSFFRYYSSQWLDQNWICASKESPWQYELLLWLHH